jgi:hypothetical protein
MVGGRNNSDELANQSMTTLLPILRDFVNLKIENKPELWDNLKNFKNNLIQVRFIDKPLKNYCLLFHVDSDGLLKSSAINNLEKFDFGEYVNQAKGPDIVISLDNFYLTNVAEEFVGWGLDFSKEDLPDSNIFTSGLKIEGDASTIQELAPLLKIIIKDLSPLATFIKKSPVNFAMKDFFEYVLIKEKMFVLREEFEDLVKGIRGFRNNIDRINKKLELLEEKKSN